MSKELLVYKSLLPYYVLMFMVLVVWAVAGEELSQYSLLAAWSDPSGWFMVAVAVMGTMMPPLVLLSWRMKEQVSVLDIEWDFREREVEYGEFALLAREYKSGYSHLMSQFSVRLALVVLVTTIAAALLPLIVVTRFQLASGWAPHMFGFLLVVLGLAVVRLVYLEVPNDASASFPRIDAHSLRKAIGLLEDTAGISWAGVRLSVGEASGYYTLRNPRVVGRIEGIESTARIEIAVDRSGSPTSTVGMILIDSNEQELTAAQMEPGAPFRRRLDELVAWCLVEYVKVKGRDDILDGLMTELGIRLPENAGSADSTKEKGDDVRE